MKISISLKWTISAVIIVIIIVVGYAYSTMRAMQQSVEQETERIQRIQYQALDELGSKTTFISAGQHQASFMTMIAKVFPNC